MNYSRNVPGSPHFAKTRSMHFMLNFKGRCRLHGVLRIAISGLYPAVLILLAAGCISPGPEPPAPGTPPGTAAPIAAASAGLATPVPTPATAAVPGLPSPTPGISPGAPAPVASQGLPSPTPGASPGASAPAEGMSLFLQTLPLDISTANYYELVNWCRRLGLDDSGDRKTLQGKLYTHYGLPSPAPAGAGEKAGKEVDIIAADLSRYFTRDKEDTEENYIRLDGNVAVSVKENNVVHSIRAQRIVVNQEKKLLIAEGDIEYKKTTGGNKTEVFLGKSLAFNLESLDGIFYDGVGETEKEVGESKSKLKFLYSGEKIVKLQNDNIIIDHAVITSSKSLEYPNWKIAASRIWVPAPEEWAARDAVLYIGDIPFLWLPFFFNPGDELFFNPVLGFRSREGNFVQTTTYLLGEKVKSQDQNSFSLINIGSAEEKNYKKELEGLFLRKIKESGTAAPAPSPEQDAYLKLMLDIYSRLGFFAGLDFNSTGLGKFMGGVGISRTIIQDVYGQYTDFAWDEDGRYLQDWNYNSFLGITLPLRYGFEGRFTLPPAGQFNFNTTFESYSDPSFPSDFYNRSENIDLIQLLDKSKQTQEITATDKTNLSWIISSSLDLSHKSLAPYISTLKFSKINFEYGWNSKTATDLTGFLFPAYDPAIQFFFPARIKIPDIQLEITGNLPELATTPGAGAQAAVKEQKPDPGKGFRMPFEKSAVKNAEKKEAQPRDELKIPASKTDNAGITLVPAESKVNVSYVIRPHAQQENVFLSRDWNSGADIAYSDQYSKLEYQVPVALNYKTNLWGNFFVLDGNLRLDLKKLESYKSPNLQFFTDQDWLNTVLSSDYRASYITLNNSLSLTLKPLFTVYDFRDSLVSYNLNWLLYNHKYDKLDPDNNPVYLDEVGKWEKTNIASHNINTSLVYSPGSKPVKWNTATQLPPLDKRVSTTLEFYVWELSNSITSAVKEVNNAWEFDPLVFQSSLSLPWLYLSQKINYNIGENQFIDSTSNLKLFKLFNQFLLEQEFFYNFKDNTTEKYSAIFNYNKLHLSFLMNRQVPLYYNYNTFGWTTDNPLTPATEPADVKIFMPAGMSFTYNDTMDPLYFWKNRINMVSDITTSWNLDFNRVTDSKMAFTFNLSFNIYKFLKLEFKVSSYNNRLYNYFPFLFDKVKRDDAQLTNIFIDLLKSFNFFRDADRYASDFKMQQVSIGLTHNLEDWDISFNLTGKYEKNLIGSNMEWKPVISILVQWVPIPELKKEIKYDDTGLNISG